MDKISEVWRGIASLSVLIAFVGGCVMSGLTAQFPGSFEPAPTPARIPSPVPSSHLILVNMPTMLPTSAAPGTVQQVNSSTSIALELSDAPKPQDGPGVSTPIPSPTIMPGPTPDGVVRSLRVPILMYHYVSEPPPDADVYRRDLSVTPQRFEDHLQYLIELGYHTITLDDLLYALAQGRPLPQKPIILTFDDGYEDHYRNVFPLLQKYGMIAHFSIITDFVNLERAGYMTWSQIEEMAAAGQRFGSHSRDHPDLAGKSVDYLVWQALGGMEAIQEHLGYHPRWITYPSGSYDQQVIAVYRSAGYWGGLTTHQGATHTLEDIFELKRVRVRGTYTAADLAVLLALDW